uniref:Cytochrome P450 2K1-like n=1 Tax=Sphaeramia orbicularis TaxID=375764 RepID=A0A673CAA5_9TELE
MIVQSGVTCGRDLSFTRRYKRSQSSQHLRRLLNQNVGVDDIITMFDHLIQSSSSVSLLGTLLVLLLVYFISSSSFSSNADGKQPPGPKPLPVLGNLLQLDLKRPYNTLLKLSKKYGSVFTIYFGPKKVVVLAGYKTVKEALVDKADVFGERDPMKIVESSKGHGVLWSNGDSWKEMRRFTLTNLRDYGMGKKACEDKIIEECQHLIEVFKTFKAFDTTQPMNYAVSNIICSLVYGSRFEYDDPEFTSMVDRTNRNIQLLGSPSIQMYNLFPWMGRWIADRRESEEYTKLNNKQNMKLFSQLKETLNPQMCRGFVDAFMVRKQTLEESGVTNSHFSNENLLITVRNLFNAGTDTTATTLRWALLLMTKYPKIQDQVQEEISRVIGTRQVQVEDRRNLPFTDAVIHETQRLANIVPMALPHKTSEDVTFQGHFIKKGTTVYPLLTSVLYDETEWEKPHSFHPAHFLDKDGKFVKQDAFMPFSAGRRICLGESLARMELFLFFTTLLQHFCFTPPPGVKEEDLDLTPRVGLTLNPSHHKLCAIPRL